MRRQRKRICEEIEGVDHSLTNSHSHHHPGGGSEPVHVGSFAKLGLLEAPLAGSASGSGLTCPGQVTQSEVCGMQKSQARPSSERPCLPSLPNSATGGIPHPHISRNPVGKHTHTPACAPGPPLHPSINRFSILAPASRWGIHRSQDGASRSSTSPCLPAGPAS